MWYVYWDLEIHPFFTELWNICKVSNTRICLDYFYRREFLYFLDTNRNTISTNFGAIIYIFVWGVKSWSVHFLCKTPTSVIYYNQQRSKTSVKKFFVTNRRIRISFLPISKSFFAVENSVCDWINLYISFANGNFDWAYSWTNKSMFLYLVTT